MDDQEPGGKDTPNAAVETIADAWAAVLIDIHEKRKANEHSVDSKPPEPEVGDEEPS